MSKNTEELRPSAVPNCNLCDTKNHSILSQAARETMQKINSGKKYGTYHKGDFLFESGEPALGFFFIRSGLIRNYRQIASKEQTFGLKGPGDWVGFRDMILGENYHHSAVCVEEAEACFIQKELAELLIKEDANFQTDVFKQMAKEWIESENQVVSLGTKQVHSKLAELLITLRNASGNLDELELKVTREILASIIGTKTETLVRALTDLKNREIVHVDKNKITIQNLNALYHLAEWDPVGS
jgi:CRP/FNR family transcriptional regulator